MYNEAAHIAACLRAIAAQTAAPYEVLVVDNNSTDTTVAIAASFPFVRIIRARKQGVVHARNAGFDVAGGDIIGRIDADSRIAPNWVARLQQIFGASAEPEQVPVAAVSGRMRYTDVSWPALFNGVDLLWRRCMVRLLGKDMVLQGSNMAIRRSVWRQIRGSVCVQPGQHEDFDLAIHVTAAGQRVAFNKDLQAAVEFRLAASSLPNFVRYALLGPGTYTHHGLKSRYYLYPLAWLLIALYGPIRLLHHGYDAQLHRFSLRALLTGPVLRRVNPATFVD